MSLSLPVVLEELPYSCAVTEEFWDEGTVCFWCLRVGASPMLVCSACQNAPYCNTTCQTLDWNSRQHRVECCIFRDASPEQLKQLKAYTGLRLIFRALSRKAFDSGRPPDKEAVGSVFSLKRRRLQRQSLEEMMFNCRNTVNNQFLRKEYSRAVELFRRLFAAAPFVHTVPDSELYSLFHTVYPNCLKVFKYQLHDGPQLIGLGLYLQEAQMVHSCQPSLERFFTGSALALRSRTPSFSPPMTICRLADESPILMTTEERQKYFKHTYGRACECPLCTSCPEFDKIKMYGTRVICYECSEALVPERLDADKEESCTLFCFRCKVLRYSITFGDYNDCKTLVKACRRVVECNSESSPCKPDFNAILAHMDMAEKIFHPVNNVLLLRLRLVTFQKAEELPTPEIQTLACRLGLAIQDTFDHYHIRTPAYPILCGKMGRLLHRMHRPHEALMWYERAKQLWRELLHGDLLPVVQEVDEVLQTLKNELNPVATTHFLNIL